MSNLPAWPQFNPKTLKRVASILESGKVNYWTGPEGKRFESMFAKWLGVRQAVSVSNGTDALHIALEALGIGLGDEVVCTPYSFRASATCVNNAGATPVFADVGEDHLLNARTIAEVITPRTKAVVVVHLYGQVADMGPILMLARKHKIFVVEDCAQCLGGEYHGKKVGTIGDVGCFSFCQSKHITTGGEGGMICARNAHVIRRVMSLRDHGWKVGSSPKEFERVGYNSRLTEIQSVVGIGEMERLDGWNLPRRRWLYEALRDGLQGSRYGKELISQWPIDTKVRKASFWLVPFVINEGKLKCSVAKFIERLQEKGAGAYKIMWPLMDDKPMARKLIGCTVGFWVHPTYTLREIRLAVKAFDQVASACIA